MWLQGEGKGGKGSREWGRGCSRFSEKETGKEAGR